MTEQQEACGTSRRPNIMGLLWALIFAVVAVAGFTGSFEWVFHSATKWIAAGLVALIGLGLVATALPGRSGR